MGTMGSHIISERFAVQRVDQFMTKRLESIKKMTSYGAWLILALVAITQVDAQECDEITYGEKSVEGLAWEGKCLYAVESNEGFQYAQAEAACASINGVLAPHMSSRDMMLFNKYHPGCSGGRTRLNMAVLFRPPNYLGH